MEKKRSVALDKTSLINAVGKVSSAWQARAGKIVFPFPEKVLTRPPGGMARAGASPEGEKKSTSDREDSLSLLTRHAGFDLKGRGGAVFFTLFSFHA